MHLYSKQLLKEAKNPSHAGVLADATHSCTRHNTLCGDRIQWTLRVVNDRVEDVSHHTRGCALCTASASLLSQRIMGRCFTEIVEEVESFIEELTSMVQSQDVVDDDLISFFIGLRHAPLRKSCVLLPWEGLKDLGHTTP